MVAQRAPFPRRPFPDGPRRTFPVEPDRLGPGNDAQPAGGPAADPCRIRRLDDSILSGQRERHEPMSSQDHDNPAADSVAGDSLSFDTSVAHPARIYNYWLGGKDNYEADRQAAEQAIAVTPDILPGVRANRAFLRRAVEFAAGQGIRQFLDIGTGLPTADNTHEVAQDIPDSDHPEQIVSELMEAVPSGSFLVISDTTTDIGDGASRVASKINPRMGPTRLTPRPRAQIAAYFDGLDLVEPGLVGMPEWRGEANPH